MGNKSKGKKRIQWLEIFFIFCLFISLPLLYFWGKSASQPEAESELRADLEVSGEFFLARLEKDQLQLQARARDYSFFRQQGQAEFFSPRIQLYTSSGLVWITSERAEYQVSPELLVFSGGVQVRFSQYLIESEQLEYLPKDNLIKIPGSLKVQGAGMELKGENAWFDLNHSRLGIDSQVSGKFERKG